MRSKCNASCLAALSVLMVISPLNMKASGNEWISTNGEWKYKEGDSYKTGWFADQKCWYYSDYQTGILKKGWVASGDAWYYLNPVNAIMQESRWVDDGKYYIGNNGAMATDTVIDGKEILADGTSVQLSDSKSVILKNAEDLVGKVIEGNLYITEEAAKDLVLSDVIVKGKIVIEGSSSITLNNVTTSEIKNNKAETTIKFEGKTQVDKVTVTRSTSLMMDDQYKGMIKEIAIQSTTKTETIVNVKANEVTSTTYAPTTINQEVGKVTLKQESSVQLNANVEELVVQASAGHSKVEVAKDVTVAKATISSESTLGGEGTVTKLEAKVDNIKVDTKVNEIVVADGVKNPPTTSGNVVAKPEESKPSGGAGGGTSGDTTRVVSTYSELSNAFTSATNVKISSGNTIILEGEFKIPENSTLTLEEGAQLVLENKLIVKGTLENYGSILTDLPKVTSVSKFSKGRSAPTSKLEIDVEKGEVNSYNNSELVFTAYYDLVKHGKPLKIKGNTKIILNNKVLVGKDTNAQVNLSQLDGSNSKLLATFGRSGDNDVSLEVLEKATINSGLSFSVSGNFQDSEIYMSNENVMTSDGNVSVALNGKANDDEELRYTPCKLYVDDQLIVGSETEGAYFYSYMGEFNQIAITKISDKLRVGVSGYAIINGNEAINSANFMIYPTNVMYNDSVLVSILGKVDNLYGGNQENPESVENGGNYRYTFNENDKENKWEELKEDGLKIDGFEMDMNPTVGEFLMVITDPTSTLFNVEWKSSNGESKKGETYRVQPKDAGKPITVILTPKFPFIGDAIEKTTEAVTSKGTAKASSEPSLYFKATLGGVEKITVDEDLTYEGLYGGVRIKENGVLSINNKLTLNTSGKGYNLAANITLAAGTLELAYMDSLVITKGYLSVNPNATVKVGKDIMIETVLEYNQKGCPIQYIADKVAHPSQQGIIFSVYEKGNKEVRISYGDVYMTESAFEALKNLSYYFDLNSGGQLFVDGELIVNPNKQTTNSESNNDNVIEGEFNLDSNQVIKDKSEALTSDINGEIETE